MVRPRERADNHFGNWTAIGPFRQEQRRTREDAKCPVRRT